MVSSGRTPLTSLDNGAAESGGGTGAIGASAALEFGSARTGAALHFLTCEKVLGLPREHSIAELGGDQAFRYCSLCRKVDLDRCLQ